MQHGFRKQPCRRIAHVYDGPDQLPTSERKNSDHGFKPTNVKQTSPETQGRHECACMLACVWL